MTQNKKLKKEMSSSEIFVNVIRACFYLSICTVLTLITSYYMIWWMAAIAG